ncbi:sensor histidine kinase [Kallotenue papyrolyticum]|uniref:sensor histidine kinase n=1 Tax=Kallotenue papyrolyticum TaxID=1325125 RepID=UPI001376CBEF|nr:ATP-binding protein [Kallotenue papyrolyticum]
MLTTEDRTITHDIITIGTLLEDVAQELQALAIEHKVTLRINDENDITVRGNPTLLARVFSNLIENGIRYNRLGGEVVITVQDNTNWVEVKVTDTGIGIPAEHCSHIFERFYRVDKSRARHTGGTGLGLSIVSHIVQQHGGRVHISSTPGEGSTFTVQLPR